jgi:hypothetical protein
MTSESRIKQLTLSLCLLGLLSALTACGGSSSNVSPGKIVIPPDGGGPDPNEPVDPPQPPVDGDTIPSIIPSSLSDAIYDSGETTSGGKPVYIIDVGALPGGALDPAGLKLGNDFVFRIEGGALRVTQN